MTVGCHVFDTSSLSHYHIIKMAYDQTGECMFPNQVVWKEELLNYGKFFWHPVAPVMITVTIQSSTCVVDIHISNLGIQHFWTP